MTEIKIRRSAEPMLVDDEDLELVSCVNWRKDKNGYVVGYMKKKFAEKFNVRVGNWYAQRLVKHCPVGLEIDHENTNKLDCQKKNLRESTHRQNTFNRNKRKDATSSKYIGVDFDANKKAYRCSIYVEKGKRVRFHCASDKDAARLYNFLAPIFYGEFARLNVL